MPTRSMLQRAHDLVRAEWRHLTTVNPSTRRWQVPFAAALASGLPLMVGGRPGGSFPVAGGGARLLLKA